MARQLTENGKRIAPSCGWAEHEEQVERVARRRARRTPPRPNVETLQPGRIHLIMKAPQCVAIATSTGKQCGRRAARGASRCVVHGGLLEAPAHKLNTRRWAEGFYAQRAAKVAARTAFYEFDAATRQTVRQAHDTAKRGKDRNKWHTLLAGAQALASDDRGKAFRRWIKHMTDQSVE